MIFLPQPILGLWELLYIGRGYVMKEKFLRIGSYVLVAALATVVTLFLAGYDGPSKLEELEGLIEERFIGEADQEALLDAAADAMVTATGDRWSYYIPASEYEAYREQMENAYVGVGITIQLSETEGEGFFVIEVNPDGPAEEAGLQVGDILIEVGGQNVREMTTAQVRDLVRGKEGTFVSMGVLRKGDAMTFSVERRKVETPVVDYELLRENTGLITIHNFDSRCAEESIAAIETLMENGAAKLIFDVRYNPGGYASELVELLDYLLPEGDLFRTVRYDGKEDVDTSDADCLEIPMVVLVNEGSYSAAEFFAAALMDYEAATVIGEQTVGKGYFQTTYQLSDGSAVALSIGEYFTPRGENLANVGVTPDIVIPLEEETDSALYYGTLLPQDDPHIQEALKILK